MSGSRRGSAPRTLADQFRSWPDESIAALLEARPDLAAPAPADSAQLAARVATRPSVGRALDGLDRAELSILEACVELAPASVEQVQAHLQAAPEAVGAAIDRLLGLALLWGTPEQLRPVTVLGELLGSVRGPSVAEVPRLLEGLTPAARALLDHLDRQDAEGRAESVTEPLEQLLARRLVVQREDRRRVALPWTVRVALRGGRSTRDRIDVPPPLAASEREPGLVDRAAAGAAFELVRRTELLLDHWGSHPVGVLRAGGLGVRELRAVASRLHLEPASAGLIIETAHAAGLLARGAADDLDPAWLPTDAFDTWLAAPVAERWLALVTAWLGNPRATGLIGGRDEADRPVNALGPELERSWLPELRRATLAELAEMPGVLAAGTGLPSLLARLHWRAPRRPASRERGVSWTLDEAAFLGITGLGGLATFARTLLDGESPLPALTALLPTPVDQVLIQADLTAVAPGPLEQELARRLALLADIESRGGATVYRFGANTIRRGYDAGWSADEIKGFLHAASRTPVPQALEYLVDDVSRTFGRVRVGVAEAFLRSDDETALTALLLDPAAAGLRLRRIAPTVVISDVPLHVLLPRLRELGSAPVVEAADGTVRVARPDVFRARTPRSERRSQAQDRTRRTARATALVATLRAGDRVAATRPAGDSASSPGDVLSLLRGTVEHGGQVLIGYVDNHGTRVDRIVRPVRVEGGQLVAHDERDAGADQGLRSYAVHRIVSVRAVPA